jgi:surface protein
MARISLQEQYENKDVIQQINILKDDVNRVSETTENIKDDVNTVSGTAEEAKTLAQQASDKVEEVGTLSQQTANKVEEVETLAQQASDTADTAVTTIQGTVTSGAIVADTVSAKLKLNKVWGGSEDSVIPIASASQTGMMNAQTYAGITNLNARISALEGKNASVYVTFPNNDPEQSIITSTFQTKAGRPPVAGDYAVDITLNLTYGYDGSVWVKVDTDVPIPQFSIDTPGLIKGNDEDGTVFAEADGTGSIKGWDALKQSVQNNTTAIEQNSTALNTKADKSEVALKADKSEVALKADKSEIEWLLDLIAPPVDCTALLTMYKGDTSIFFTPIINASGCTSLREMFSGCTKLRTATCIYTSYVTDMGHMFSGCSSLASVPEMDTSNVTDMEYMFSGCSSLASVPEMDTSNVTNMHYMFSGCSSLASVPEMDTSNVTNMNYMFRGCKSLVSVPEMDTSNVTDMEYMFYQCSSLTSVPEMDTSKVTDTNRMFAGCSSLTSVTFIGNRVPPYDEMFASTPIAAGNGSIYVPDEMVSAYKAASGWSSYASVIKGISEKP